MIVCIMQQHGFNMVTYIDDYIGIALAQDAQRQFDFLSNLLTRLSLPMNPDKHVPLAGLLPVSVFILIS